MAEPSLPLLERGIGTPRSSGAVSTKAAGFAGALRAPDSIDFNLGSQFTIEASVNPGSANTDFNHGIVVRQDAASGRLVYGFALSTNCANSRSLLKSGPSPPVKRLKPVN